MNEEEYRFYPRPEAHSMAWDELLPPLRRAVRDLLLRLDGAVQKVDETLTNTTKGGEKDGEKTASCFLVYGERGSGKSTVLMTAKDAVSNGKVVYSVAPAGHDAKTSPRAESDAQQLRDEARKYAASLESMGTVWLEVLDLEPLPPKANMLTTMLTRIREALDSGLHNRAPELASIIEEGSESARNKLTRLINDATFIWEDIQESDTRNRANRQIAAAGIYTHFRDRFSEAVEALSKELARKRGNLKYIPIILPIDNIDRSTDHLHSIIKMAEMVASPYLWLVMAGDREDLDTFLTRGFWKDLLAGATGAGKAGVDEEDEALVIARRQAASASHKLLPPDHRVEVQLMSPEETLNFSPSWLGKDARLRKLLREVKIVESMPQSMSLLDLFDAQTLIHGKDDEDDPSCLTKAAARALYLPARGVLDLWQSVYWAASDKTEPNRAQSRHRAEMVTRTMLRNRIAESKVSNKLGLYLQEFIVGSQPDGSTIIKAYYPNPSFAPRQWRHENHVWCYSVIPFPQYGRYPRKLHSVIILPESEETFVLSLKTQDKNHNEKLEPELPRVVTGWMMILYDIIAQVKQSWIVEGFPAPTAELIKVQHYLSPPLKDEVSHVWPMPEVHTFLATDVIARLWFEFSSVFYEDLPDDPKPFGEITLRKDYIPWTMVIGWIACIIDTVLIMGRREGEYEPCKEEAGPYSEEPYREPHSEYYAADGSRRAKVINISTRVAGVIKNRKERSCACFIHALEECEQIVFTAACTLYDYILRRCNSKGTVLGEVMLTTYLVWFTQKMPLLLGRFYVPMEEELATRRESNLKSVLNELAGYSKEWRDNPAFLAHYESQLARIFTEGDQPNSEPTWPENDDFPLYDLYRLFPKQAKKP